MKLQIVAAVGLLSFSAGARAQTTHDYEFTNGLADSVVGGVALLPSDRGSATGVVSGGFYNFDQGAGLTLGSQLPGASYTIEISTSFANVSGYNKLISFNNLNDDTGLYILNGALELYNVANGVANLATASTPFNARLSRDGTTGLITGFLNGAVQFTYADTGNLFLASTNLFFLRDDMRQNGEDSAGSADYIRISDVSTGAPPVSAPVVAVPEPASWAMMILGMGAVGFALRRRQRVTTRVSYAA